MRLALLAVLLASGAAHAQPLLDVLTRADGLPSDYVLAVHQDRWGFLWFGTDAGTVRWDGRRARTFSIDEGLPHPYVKGFAETADGTLWAATNRGLARRTVTGWEAQDSPLGDSPIGGITTDDQGRLLVSNRFMLARLEDGRWRSLYRETGLGRWDAPLLDVGDGRILVSGFHEARALLLTPENSGAPEAGFRAEPLAIEGIGPLTPGTYVAVYRIGGRLIGAILSERGKRELVPLRLDLSAKRILAGAPLLDAPIPGLAGHGSTTYVFGSGGIREVDLQSGTFSPFILTDHVVTTASDGEGGVWVGTFGSGVARIGGTHLTSLTDRPARRIALAGDEAWAAGVSTTMHADLSEQEPRVWSINKTGPRSVTVTPDGRFRLSGQAWLFAPTTTAETKRGLRGQNGLLNEVEDGNWVSGSAETADSLWLGSYGSGVRRFLKASGALVEVDTVSTADGLPTETVEDVVRTRAGTWAITRQGLALVRGGRARALGVAQGLPSSAVYSLYEARDGTHWVGTNHGVARLAPEALQPGGRWRAEAIGAQEMEGEAVVAFFERAQAPEAVWAVTTRGLWRIEGGRARAVGGFPLVRDRRETIEHAAYHAPSDRLLLATSAGVSIADLGALPASAPEAPPAAIVGARVDGDEVPLAGTPRRARLADLVPGRHRVEIAVAALQFSGTGRVEWRTESRGADSLWREAVDGRISLEDVGAGTHVVEVRAVAPGGAVSPEAARVIFSVTPQWWERRAVQALLALAMVGLLVVGVRYASQRRLRARVRQLEVAERVRAERERISRDLHDHVGAEVAAILTHAEVGRLRASARGDNADDLREVEHRARRTMGSLREAIWALGQSTLTASTLAARLERFSNVQTGPLGFTVDVRATGDSDRPLAPAQALALYRIGQEAIRNAAQHSGGSHLDIVVSATPRYASITVRDDGSFASSGDGAPPNPGAPVARGLGLRNMRARAEAVGGTFALANGGGTTIRAEIPLVDS
ncbi:sensor histidine kinase [Rubricoccus marinus]|uniref:histidine kinase n=1 Tax=Rubricoccus marinus TaxID=716817 RepID=A0A259TXD3_9BACT|nr:two-component regulator propeller domain-containing protein [Rubricoccus marinus]OZC02423.1 hypothetical protein BSZ36_05190 [Rubricoccus marinus]